MDPALLALMELVVPPSRPQMVQERLLLSPKAAAAQKYTERTATAFAAYAEQWRDRLRRGRSEYAAIPVTALSEADATSVNELIHAFEQMAEIRARDLV